MEIENIQISKIIPYEKNPRKNEKAVEIVMKSINSNLYKVMGFKDTMPKIKFCEECNKQFKVRPSQYERRKTCSLKCAAKRRTRVLFGKKAPNWKGGIEIHNLGGWIWVYCPEHPKAHKGKVAEHRLVMEKHLGRYLTKDELVHHINENQADNRIENLELHDRSSHAKLHHPKGRKFGR